MSHKVAVCNTLMGDGVNRVQLFVLGFQNLSAHIQFKLKFLASDFDLHFVAGHRVVRLHQFFCLLDLAFGVRFLDSLSDWFRQRFAVDFLFLLYTNTPWVMDKCLD